MPKRRKKTPISSKKQADPISDSNRTGPVTGLHEWRGHSRARVPWEVLRGDAKSILTARPADQFHCVITSPPYYWQRDYKTDGQIGKEPTIHGYVTSIVATMEAVRNVLRPDGVLFLNLGDTYYSAKGQPKGEDRKNGARRFGLRAVDASGLGVARKTTIGIPWRVAIAMIDLGWTLRSPIIWHRKGSIPEPTAKDRPWRSYEMLFLFSKTPRYFFRRDQLGTEEDIWTISSRPKNSGGVHSAAFPDELVQKCLRIGCPPDGLVLDPFAGSGTVLRVAIETGRPATGIDLSEKYCDYMVRQLQQM